MSARGAVPDDGRHAFDFLQGRWRVQNRKLADLLDRNCTTWVEFDATVETRLVLHGLGNVDSFVAVLPNGTEYEALTVRFFSPESRMWSIWSASTTRLGHMDPPVKGIFENGRGEFVCDDVLNGTPVRVRFVWRDISSGSAHWEQAFSYDGGLSWQLNWTMALERIDE